MKDNFFNDLLKPEIVWGFNCKNKVSHIKVMLGDYETVNYHFLVHPDDVDALELLIKKNMRTQRRRFQRSRHVISLHRVRDSSKDYRLHLCVITLTRDNRNEPSFIAGFDWPIPEEVPLPETEMRYLSHMVRNANEGLSELIEWLNKRLRSWNKDNPNPPPRPLVWRCAGHYIYPSLSEMMKIGDNSTIALSLRQKRFIEMLLNSADRVERQTTRRVVFNINTKDPSSDPKDNDIDQLVTFFRRHFGRRSIRTIKGVGHYLRPERHLCEGAELEDALSFLE